MRTVKPRRAARRAADRTLFGAPIAGGRLHAFVALLVMLASALQGIAAQGHVHAESRGRLGAAGFVAPHVDSGAAASAAAAHADGLPAARASATRGAGRDGSTPPAPSQDSQFACGLCQALAAGTAPLAHPVGRVPTHAAVRFVVAPDPRATSGETAVSYDWTSRGPPLI